MIMYATINIVDADGLVPVWHQAICIHNAMLKSNDAKQMMINTQGNVYQDLRYMAFIRMFTTEWYQNIDEEHYEEPVLMP